MSTVEAQIQTGLPDLGVQVETEDRGFLDIAYRRWLIRTQGSDTFVEAKLAGLVTAASLPENKDLQAAAGLLLEGYVALIATNYLENGHSEQRLYNIGQCAVQEYFQQIVATRRKPKVKEALDTIAAAYLSPAHQNGQLSDASIASPTERLSPTTETDTELADAVETKLSKLLHNRFVDPALLPEVPPVSKADAIHAEITGNNVITVGEQPLTLKPHQLFAFNALLLLRDRPSTARELRALGFCSHLEKPTSVRQHFSKTMAQLIVTCNAASSADIIIKSGPRRATRYMINPRFLITDRRSPDLTNAAITQADLARIVTGVQGAPDAASAVKTAEEDLPTEAAKAFTFEDIIWKLDGNLYYRAWRENHINLVKLLLAHGGLPLVKIENNYSKHMPYEYEFAGGVSVEFMPHWEEDLYEVEGWELKLPLTAEVLLEDIEAARLGKTAPSSFRAYLTAKQRRYEAAETKPQSQPYRRSHS